MRRRNAGLSMVELMIAIVLSIAVIDAALSLLLANRNTSYTTTAISAVSDNGRVALNFISQSVRSGGYMACNATNDLREIATGKTRQISILTAGATPVQHNYLQAFGGYEALNTAPGGALTVANMPVVGDGTVADWSTNTGNLDGLLSGKVTKGSDILVVRESLPEANPIYTTAPYLTGAGQTTLAVNTIGNLTAGQFAVISNCIVSTAFQVASAAGTTIGTNGGMDLFGGDLSWGYGNPSAITPVDMYIYFVGPGRDTDSSLWVFDEIKGTFRELVPDVENMQVLYGVAPTSPNQVTQYQTANNVVDFNQVVSVKIALLMASTPGLAAVTTTTAATVQTYSLLNTVVTPPLDSRLRKVFTTTIGVRNAAL